MERILREIYFLEQSLKSVEFMTQERKDETAYVVHQTKERISQLKDTIKRAKEST